MKINESRLAGCRACMDFIVMDIRAGSLTIEKILPTLLDPHQPQLQRDLTPMEHVEALSTMLALALTELAKNQ